MSRLGCRELLFLSSRLPGLYIIVRDSQLFASLKIKDFQLLWISSAFAAFGLQMRGIAQGWLIYELTQSPMALTWVMLAFLVPSAIFSLVGGVIADRVSKKNIMIFARLFKRHGDLHAGIYYFYR